MNSIQKKPAMNRMYFSLVAVCLMASALVMPVHSSSESLTAGGGFSWSVNGCGTLLTMMGKCTPGLENQQTLTNTQTSGGSPSSNRPSSVIEPSGSIRPASRPSSSIPRSPLTSRIPPDPRSSIPRSPSTSRIPPDPRSSLTARSRVPPPPTGKLSDAEFSDVEFSDAEFSDAELAEIYEPQEIPTFGMEHFMTCDQMIAATAAIENAWNARRCS